MVNKVLWEIDNIDASLAWFGRDPDGFLAGWEDRDPTPPHPTGGALTDRERVAIRSLDFESLYEMGANPFLLWQFARSAGVTPSTTVDELIERFREAVAPHGYPDFRTWPSG